MTTCRSGSSLSSTSGLWLVESAHSSSRQTSTPSSPSSASVKSASVTRSRPESAPAGGSRSREPAQRVRRAIDAASRPADRRSDGRRASSPHRRVVHLAVPVIGEQRAQGVRVDAQQLAPRAARTGSAGAGPARGGSGGACPTVALHPETRATNEAESRRASMETPFSASASPGAKRRRRGSPRRRPATGLRERRDPSCNRS